MFYNEVNSYRFVMSCIFLPSRWMWVRILVSFSTWVRPFFISFAPRIIESEIPLPSSCTWLLPSSTGLLSSACYYCSLWVLSFCIRRCSIWTYNSYISSPSCGKTPKSITFAFEFLPMLCSSACNRTGSPRAVFMQLKTWLASFSPSNYTVSNSARRRLSMSSKPCSISCSIVSSSS